MFCVVTANNSRNYWTESFNRFIFMVIFDKHICCRKTSLKCIAARFYSLVCTLPALMWMQFSSPGRASRNFIVKDSILLFFMFQSILALIAASKVYACSLILQRKLIDHSIQQRETNSLPLLCSTFKDFIVLPWALSVIPPSTTNKISTDASLRWIFVYKHAFKMLSRDGYCNASKTIRQWEAHTPTQKCGPFVGY